MKAKGMPPRRPSKGQGKRCSKPPIPSRTRGGGLKERIVTVSVDLPNQEIAVPNNIAINVTPGTPVPVYPLRVMIRSPRASALTQAIKAVNVQSPDVSHQALVVRNRSYNFTGNILAGYRRQPQLMEMIMDGGYIYVNGRFCLPISSCFVTDGKGKFYVNKSVWNDPEDYFLSWKSNYHVLAREGSHRYPPRVKRIPGGIFVHAGAFDIKKTSKEELIALLDDGGGGGGGGDDFHELLRYYMNTAGMSVGTLADETGLDDSTIKRYLREKKDPPDVPIIVALCIALRLLPMCSDKLLRSAGRVFTSSWRDRIYQLLLNTAYIYSVQDCNIFLKEIGLPPLTKK